MTGRDTARSRYSLVLDGEGKGFVTMILDNLQTAGVQQAHKDDKIAFSSIASWPGNFVSAEGRCVEVEGGTEKRAAIFIGPEFGTVSRRDLVAAAREAGDADFDVVIACAFNYDAIPQISTSSAAFSCSRRA